MDMNKPITTELGIIEGRDGIYLDSMKQEFSPSRLFFVGEINSDLCTNNQLTHKWYAYEIVFNTVEAYDCRWIDISRWKTVSSFDEIHESNFIDKLGLATEGLNHYLFSTYDYIYSVIAKNFEFKITGKR